MVKVVFVKKNGTLKNSSIKLEDLNNLYKKCLFSSNKNFEQRNSWSIDDKTFYSIFCKNTGKSGSENKYELPPPIDSELFFGTLVILKHSKKMLDIDNLQDLSLDEWENVYNKLFGGFEDIEDEEEDSEEEYIDPKNLTKQGYDKSDGFIVDDDELAAGALACVDLDSTVEFVRGFFTSDFPEQSLPFIAEENFKFPRHLAAQLLRDAAFGDWRDVIQRIRCRTLVVGGEASIFTSASQRWIASQIPNGEVEIFPEREGGSHFMFVENQDRFNSRVLAFLES